MNNVYFSTVKPRIDRTNLNPITVKAGLPVSLDVKVFGEPPAKVTWHFKGEELQNRENLEIINVDYNTKFLMTKSKRAHSGKYVIKAKNEVGEDEAEVEITILGENKYYILDLSILFSNQSCNLCVVNKIEDICQTLHRFF